MHIGYLVMGEIIDFKRIQGQYVMHYIYYIYTYKASRAFGNNVRYGDQVAYIYYEV